LTWDVLFIFVVATAAAPPSAPWGFWAFWKAAAASVAAPWALVRLATASIRGFIAAPNVFSSCFVVAICFSICAFYYL
jgi:hypothetical protein